MPDDFEPLRQALRRMPAPQPRAGFVDRALATAVSHAAPPAAVKPGRLRYLLTRWELWVAALLGGAVAATLTLLLVRPAETTGPGPQLALHETRNVEVLIDSERELKGATIRVAASGGIVLHGFEDEREIGWQADLERGTNLLSLPVVARAAGRGRLVAIVEHEGRTRRIAVELEVVDPQVSQS